MVSRETLPTHLPVTTIKISLGQQTLQSLHGQSTILLGRNLQTASHSHALPIDIPEPQPDLSLDLLLVRHLAVSRAQPTASPLGHGQTLRLWYLGGDHR